MVYSREIVSREKELTMSSGIFFHSDNARNTMYKLVNDLPEDIEVYLVGGAVRNALVKKYHNETWLQRDYDQAITKCSAQYFGYLESLGFSYGTINDTVHKVMSKTVVGNGRELSYEDNLVFDMHVVDGTTIQENLLYSTGLSINGFALSLRDVFDENWENKLIQLPGALESIKNKQININEKGYTSESNYFFALLRFIGTGFLAPSREDSIKLLKTIDDLSSDRYARNIMKLVNYVGGESRAREIASSLGIEGLDIFNEQATRRFIKKL